MDSGLDFHTARALLAWQVELGVDEAMLDAPLNRYDVPAKVEKAAASVPAAAAPPQGSAVELAQAAASGAPHLGGLRAAMEAFEQCELKRGARNLVFADGTPGARVMIIGEAPGRDEDREGRPFVGRAGQLLDRMLGAIGLGRAEGSVYITNVLPWRPPQNRDPQPEEIDMMRPFVARHVALAAPEVVILMGNISCVAGLGQRGITKLRGTWAEAYGVPALPMFHPAYLLRNPGAKREAWADLLALQAHLRMLRGGTA
ncbi:uracil-DNA glycosylase [Roseovarius sp. LXJ103]|uniref:uracil-DNA glycosylase n=1 Tax=Roseovarius carneus TaxID=2853164 RepID=UPI000D60CDDB|nr:uracil-DNA glycosylase [Roseovarius carneus]MBZ8118174.1 uracil-DNA glycosylase [Roseovarius carneus]PWE36095.1 uracil-DNA glycosylase [Pelagicola sp. LXJ1103]